MYVCMGIKCTMWYKGTNTVVFEKAYTHKYVCNMFCFFLYGFFYM